MRLECVTSRNCVSLLIACSSSARRPTLVSSSAASTSSSTQNGLGWNWKMPTSSASAVSAFSPPESSSTFCNFLPGGEATISIPLSAWFSASVSRRKACPPWKSLRERQPEVLVDARERLVKLLPRNLVDLLDRRLRVLDGLDQILALRLKEARAARPSPCTPPAPSCSPGPSLPGFWRSVRQVSSSTASISSAMRKYLPACAARQPLAEFTCCRQLPPCAPGLTGASPPGWTAAARDLRATGPVSARKAFSCVSIVASCCRNVHRLLRHCLGLRQRFRAAAQSTSCSRCASRAFSDALLRSRACRCPLLLNASTRRSRSLCIRSMRWNAASAPRRRSSSPASSAVRLRCFLLQRLARLPQCASLRAAALRASLRPFVRSLSSRTASSRFCSMTTCLASRASLLRSACSIHSCSRRSMRCASFSICFSAAPWSAASRSACRRSSLRVSSCASNPRYAFV